MSWSVLDKVSVPDLFFFLCLRAPTLNLPQAPNPIKPPARKKTQFKTPTSINEKKNITNNPGKYILPFNASMSSPLYGAK